VHQGYIEPHACTVSCAADGRVTIWSSSQGQFMVRAMTSLLTGIPQSDIRAIPAEIGGGFGGKTIIYLEPVAVMLSRKSGRPVKMVMTRDEVQRATGPAPGSRSTVKIGARKDGTVAGWAPSTQAGACPAPAGRAGRLRLRAFSIRTCFDRMMCRTAEGRGLSPVGGPLGLRAECVVDEIAQASHRSVGMR